MDKMKRLLFVVPSLVIGGLERMQITLANALDNAGYDVTVMTLSPENPLATELNETVHLLYKPNKNFHIVKRIPYIRHKFYDDGMWETRASARKLHRYYIGNEKYDVEIAFFRGLSVKIVSGFKEKNTGYLAWVHNDFEKADGYKNNFKSMREVYEAYSRFDRVICVSEQAKEGFRKIIGDTGNLTTIYNMLPVDEICKKAREEPQRTVKKNEVHIVLVGRLVDHAKGQKRLINVVGRLHEEGKDISLAIIGGGSDEQMLREAIRMRNAEGYITMTGSQRNPYPYIREADLLVCASYFEGYNLTVAEALILGVPVLSTNCTGPNEILDHGKYGMIVENSEEGLYFGLKKLTENPKILNYYRDMAMKRQSFFDEKKIMRQIIRLFGK